MFLLNVGELLLYYKWYILEDRDIHSHRSEILKRHILLYHWKKIATAASSIMKLNRGPDPWEKVRNNKFTKCNT
jgi:hypothetical protein